MEKSLNVGGDILILSNNFQNSGLLKHIIAASVPVLGDNPKNITSNGKIIFAFSEKEFNLWDLHQLRVGAIDYADKTQMSELIIESKFGNLL